MRDVRIDDRGDTLVELLVAMVIMSIAAVAILAGFEFSISGSALGRSQATSDAYVRSAAEAIQNSTTLTGGYKACTNAASASSAAAAYQSVGQAALNNAAAGYTLTVASPKAWSGSSFGSCSGTDYGLQQLLLTVKSTKLGTAGQAIEQLTIIVRRPCNSATAYSSASPCT